MIPFILKDTQKRILYIFYKATAIETSKKFKLQKVKECVKI